MTDLSTMPAAAPASRLPGGHYRFTGAARMEWIKLRSLRSTWWTLVITVAGAIAIGVTVGINTGVYMEIVSGLSGNEEVVRSLTTALSSGEQARTVLDDHYHLGFQPALVKANHN